MLPETENPLEPRMPTRRGVSDGDSLSRRGRLRKSGQWLLALSAVMLVAAIALLTAHFYLLRATRDNLPQLDGTASIPGLLGPVVVRRDAQGVPTIEAQSLDDLILAQAWVTTHDRLWQMDVLRRHAAGELAAILGASLLPHDRLQRTLQIRAAADRALAAFPPDQAHQLAVYARGVNAAMEDQHEHLPVEFRVLRYQPAPWTPRDSVLVALALFQDLTNNYQAKLNREVMAAGLPAEMVADLYPVGSWRDHPPTQPPVDLSIDGPAIEEIPLDESQSRLGFPELKDERQEIAAQVQAFIEPGCAGCVPGSNNWVVAGSRTASGKPMLSNDTHLNHGVPGIWYEAGLQAPFPGAEDFHVAGVTLPGIPFVILGHNAHIAWGVTNLGADVQDVYVEQTRNNGEEYLAADGSWQPMLHLRETIEVHGGGAEQFEVRATRHGDAITPVLTPLLKGEARTVSLRWTMYDPSVVRMPFLAIDSAHDWSSFVPAIAQFGGPAQNFVYADDAGHIGYHATGRVPLRGQATPSLPSNIASPNLNLDTQTTPTLRNGQSALATSSIEGRQPTVAASRSGPLPSVPVATSLATEWTGYIPFEQLPAVYDPPGGLIVTANSRITPDDYPYPITLNWGDPYRNERLWRLLSGRRGLKPSDMLALESDIYSDFDHVLAQRIAYAVDHATSTGQSRSSADQSTLRAAADLLRAWNGNVDANSPAANIVVATRRALWPMLLMPHLGKRDYDVFYSWFSRDYALEQMVMHTPARWLPPGMASWDDLLTAALDQGLRDAKAPQNGKDLAKWRYGKTHVVDIEHPIFGQSRMLRALLGLHTGTGAQPQSGDGTTVKQVGRVFGPSQRFTADLGDLDGSTLNVVLGESGNPASAYFLDQFQAWYHGSTFPLPFSERAVAHATKHTLTLVPRT